MASKKLKFETQGKYITARVNRYMFYRINLETAVIELLCNNYDAYFEKERNVRVEINNCRDSWKNNSKLLKTECQRSFREFFKEMENTELTVA